MKSFDYSRRVAVEYETDVLVAGGGPAGLCAAVAAARCGARTMLIEKNGFCGGMATAGLVAPFMTCYDSGGELMLIRGLFEEIVDRLVGRSGAIHPSLVETSSAFTSYITAGHIHVTPKAETPSWPTSFWPRQGSGCYTIPALWMSISRAVLSPGPSYIKKAASRPWRRKFMWTAPETPT